MNQYIDRKEMLVFLTELRGLIDTTIQRISSVPIVSVNENQPAFVDEANGFIPIGNEPLSNHPNDPIVNLNKNKTSGKKEIAPGVYSDRPLSPRQALLEAKLVPIISEFMQNPLSILENDPLTL